MVNGLSFMLPLFFLFFVFIIILIYYSTVKEKEFTESAKLMIERQFPQLQTIVISEGGFLSNPEISASPIDKHYPIRDLSLRYKVYSSGKHQKQDLLLSAFISTNEPKTNEFSVIVKKQGFFWRIFGGENVQLGHQTLDDCLLIRGSNPDLVRSYLSRNDFQIASRIANISDLKECKLEHYGDSINVVIRSDHTNIHYVNALLGLISALANAESLYPKQYEKSNLKTTTSRVFERIPRRKQRFKDVPRRDPNERSQTSFHELSLDKIDITEKMTEKTSFFENIKKEILDKSYLASDHKILDTSAELTFNIGYFQKINFNWDTTSINVSGVKELSLIPFRVFMKTISWRDEKLSYYDPFEEVEVKTDPKEIFNSLKERTEIARTFTRLTGDLPSTLEIISDKKTVSFLIIAPSQPENIDPIYDLIKNISLFLEFSFINF
ncbi:MAG: hypothetical protein ACFFFH_17020 [Candidatus Thorarchaeota archaeon]